MMIDFTAKPANRFNEFITLYYDECSKKVPKIEVIAGKWDFEDLIPGLSDFDTRFICSDDMTDDDWCNMSSAIGEVHLDICTRYPEWARLLEHLPGVNVTWSEFTDDFSYYTEYRQWSFYHCRDSKKLEEAEQKLSEKSWDVRDEYFFLNKFFSFYGHYNREIDPAINVGVFTNKYPLHSRMMHYFTPPVRAAVSIILKKAIKGKFESLRIAKELFPELNIFNEIFDAVDKHYEIPKLYDDSELSNLEERLFHALKIIFNHLKRHINIIPEEMRKNESTIKKALKEVVISPQLKVFDSSRFSRLFKGRMYFYMNAPKHFDNLWLIQNELARVGEMFYKTPYRIFWHILKGEKVDNPDCIVQQLVPSILSQSEADATLKFSNLTPGIWEKGSEIEVTGEIVEIFDDFFIGLNKIKRLLAEELKQI